MGANQLFSEEEYLAAERPALEKSEFLAGEIVPVPGSNHGRVLLMTNLIAALGNVVRDRGEWLVLGGSMRLYVPAGPLFTYPSAMLVGEPVTLRDDGYRDNLLNPILIAQVLPEEKSAHFRRVVELYFSIPTVRCVLLLNASQPRVSVNTRQANSLYNVIGFSGLEGSVEVPELDFHLPLADIYRKVPLAD